MEGYNFVWAVPGECAAGLPLGLGSNSYWMLERSQNVYR